MCVGAVCRPYVLSPLAPSLAPASPTPRAGRRPSAVGSHVIQRGEGAELRGQAAAQAVITKLPASERGTRGGVERGEREGGAAREGGHGSCRGCVPALRTTAPSPSQSSAGETGWGKGAQFGAAVGAIANRRLIGANGAKRGAGREPRHEQQ